MLWTKYSFQTQFWKKYLEQSKKIKRNWKGPKKFDIYF